jgi:hypothetical protein
MRNLPAVLVETAFFAASREEILKFPRKTVWLQRKDSNLQPHG